MCTLYDRIIELCSKKGVTGSRMCLDLGLSKSTLSDIKSGRKKGVSTTTAQKMANYLDVPVEYLLTGELPNGFCFPDDENPHTLELCDAFETLPIDDQIHVKNWVVAYAADPEKAKKSPDQPKLTEGEQALLELFRLVPQDKQQLVLNMIRAALGGNLQEE